MEKPKFINGKIIYDEIGQYLWIVEKDGNHKKLADLRGWGGIQQLCRNPITKTINIEKAEKMQDDIGRWVAEAINEKIARS